MRVRAVVAAVLGSGAAALGHVLDATGRLPLVHESADVRLAMHAPAVAIWLVAAAVVAAVAATTRPLLFGAPAAVVVSAAPEVVGRHDPGAVLEPGAMLGALLQLLLVVAIAALAAALERSLRLLVRVPPLQVPRSATRQLPQYASPLRARLLLRLRGPPLFVVL